MKNLLHVQLLRHWNGINPSKIILMNQEGVFWEFIKNLEK